LTTVFGRRVGYLVCVAATVVAAGVDARAQAPARLERALRTLADDAVALPPELAADALIRIAGSARVNNTWKRQLLTDAFFKAYAVREAYRRSTTQSLSPETRQGADLLASSMSLNRVSLQVRAAQLMAYVDQRGARELFEWIDLNPSEGICEDPLVATVDEYYTALSLLARTTFGGNRGDALRFFELYIWRARLPSEMPAVARAMLRFDPQGREIPYFESLFSSILQTGSRDPRGFSASALDIVTRTSDFLAFEAKAGLEGIHLMDTMRGYLVNQMKGPRCADSLSESMTPPAFNTALRRAGLQFDVRPIEETILPSRMMGTERIDQFWQTGEARGLRERLFQLRGPGKDPLPLRVRETTEWKNDADQLLNAVEQWTGRSERVERDYLAQKSLLFQGLLELVPPSTLRTRTIRAYVEYLRHADKASELESLWFAFVNRLLELSRGNDRNEILTAFDNAHHPALAVYAQLERLVPVGAR
jgi:hypothetical protein